MRTLFHPESRGRSGRTRSLPRERNAREHRPAQNLPQVTFATGMSTVTNIRREREDTNLSLREWPPDHTGISSQWIGSERDG